jgi:hypothetical protein
MSDQDAFRSPVSDLARLEALVDFVDAFANQILCDFRDHARLRRCRDVIADNAEGPRRRAYNEAPDRMLLDGQVQTARNMAKKDSLAAVLAILMGRVRLMTVVDALMNGGISPARPSFSVSGQGKIS